MGETFFYIPTLATPMRRPWPVWVIMLLTIPLVLSMVSADDDTLGSIEDLSYPLPVGMWGARSMVLDNGQVLLCGGISDDGHPTNATFLFDPEKEEEDPFERVDDMHHPRAGHALIMPTSGGVYAIGGYENRTIDGNRTDVTVANIERFDPANNTWVLFNASMITPRVGLELMETSNGEILALGGYDLTGMGIKTTEKYVISSKLWISSGELAQARVGGVFVGLPDGNIMAIGGSDKVDGMPTASTEVYDRTLSTWNTGAEMGRPRAGCVLITLDEERYIVAGGKTGKGVTDTAEMFDHKESSWSDADPMPAPICCGSLTADERFVYVAGGTFNGSVDARVFLFDIEKKKWRDSGILTHGQEDPTLVTVTKNRVHMFGGSDGTKAFNGVQVYTPPNEPSEPFVDLDQIFMIAIVTGIVGLLMLAFFLRRHDK